MLKDGLGDEFDNTLVLTLTEFGRKFEQNGGYGTEHGYGTAILMAGGREKGGGSRRLAGLKSRPV